MSWDEIFGEVAKEMGIGKGMVRKIYMTYWKGVRDHVIHLPLKAGMKKEEFDKVKVNINIPSIGKMYASWDTYEAMMEWRKIRMKYKELKREEYAARENDQADVHEHCDDGKRI